ncbi:1-deoxy-D-xylulose-5-phosphate reductoisomerase [Helicobacter turcicus]|uniref:1-deoxy-D-xylulose 5-phosphate reductoisomerase n=1 Tax=Helicobacter turcicus TaxID=2867412 RepID=A0ABS7JMA7_9HELI|nr:1-deoxy-D-xylulose-5-phosphate reductoisomerase [Helicobacter turcicus]MBX7490531.1 1-deoxy-D-xylulose-5-phosphate reductoisomerase [Helicobacter turcicus]MBX7545390.1 1-deoxy-D-xylulose-5-phosphate reductoisomerase [Helicobacter turcicus]
MIILGSSGSIGVNALAIAARYKLPIEVLGVGKNIALLNAQILQFRPKAVIIADSNDKSLITSEFKGKIYTGNIGILQAIIESQSKLVINALVGFIGLEPTLCAINCGKKVALANKESLVVGGDCIDMEYIIPIDSEHFSLSYLLNFNKSPRPFRNLYITASGGAFRDTPLETIPQQSATNALKHPNWKMGKKITIDSATMVNKLFEILEAYWLFGSKNIDAFIERNSHIHGLVEFLDGSVVAHLAHTNMQLPIAYAICFGLGLQEQFLRDFGECKQKSKKNSIKTCDSIIERLNFQNINYKLQNIDPKRYPLWNLKNTLLENPKLGLVLNASNEVAVEAFLQDSIVFGRISEIIQSALEAFKNPNFNDMDSIRTLDLEVREYARKLL